MKKMTIIFILFIFLFFASSCDPFNYPSGVWVCEELGITIDFDIGKEFPNGEILIDGTSEKIECSVGSGGSTTIRYATNNEELYIAWFINKGKNKMIFRLVENRKEYIFIKQNPME
jgi:hypothetical protein